MIEGTEGALDISSCLCLFADFGHLASESPGLLLDLSSLSFFFITGEVRPSSDANHFRVCGTASFNLGGLFKIGAAVSMLESAAVSKMA